MPDDNDIEEMDPIMRSWMFYNWLEDYNDEFKLLENQGYLIGSFTNPEAVKKILGNSGEEKHISTDTEFTTVLNQLDQFDDKQPIIRKHKRKRRIQG
jgi:hypothetical protein